MMQIPIYTIGYGSRSIDEFIALLKKYAIEFLIDVRSQPYSRYNPLFSKEALEKQLKQHNIRYVYMGDTLGGRPGDDACYLPDGRVDYSKVREKSFYQEGISRLHTAWEKQLSVAIMCSEIKPQECHRSKLVGNTLVEEQIKVAHIDEAGKIKTQDDVNRLLMGDQPVLFGESEEIGFSRKKYISGEENLLIHR